MNNFILLHNKKDNSSIMIRKGFIKQSYINPKTKATTVEFMDGTVDVEVTETVDAIFKSMEDTPTK